MGPQAVRGRHAGIGTKVGAGVGGSRNPPHKSREKAESMCGGREIPHLRQGEGREHIGGRKIPHLGRGQRGRRHTETYRDIQR